MSSSALVDLPADILDAVAIEIAGSVDEPPAQYSKTVSRLEEVHCVRSPQCTGQHPLLPLSATCSRLRSVCLPILFRFLALNSSVTRRSQQLPAVLKYVQTVHTNSSPPPHTLASILSATTGLRELKCLGDVNPFVLTIPSITAITLCDSTIRWDARLKAVGRPLRVLKMVFSSRWAGVHAMLPEDLEAEREFVESLVLPNRLCIEEVVLPGEIIRLSLLTTSPWPSLRELALTGAYPDDAVLVPFVDLLCILPRLRVLTIGLAPRRRQSPLHVWPPGVVPARLPVLDRLTRFSLSFPLEDDRIFAHLPADLSELALRDSPRYYYRQRWVLKKDPNEVGYAAPGPLLTCSAATGVLLAIAVQPRLKRLELVVQARDTESEPALYAQVAATCPGLRVFELHRYRADDGSSVPLPAILEGLRALQSLTELRLNLDFPPFSSLGGFIVNYEQMSRFLDDSAQLVAGALPWLESIAFLENSSSNVYYWTTWTVNKAGDGGAVAERVSRRIFEADMPWL